MMRGMSQIHIHSDSFEKMLRRLLVSATVKMLSNSSIYFADISTFLVPITRISLV